jgi:CRISPR-associated protein (TIGR02710 family)
VGGKRNDQGTVISGRERVIIFSYETPRTAVFCKRLVELYNSYHYGSALQIAEQINKATSSSDNLKKRKTETLYRVCKLAYLWDKFEFKEASETTLELLGYAEEAADLVGSEADPLRIQENIKAVADYLAGLTEDEKKKQINQGLVWELIKNAERKAANSLWDDAVGRLYRAIEYIGQLKLYEIGLFDGDRFLPPEDESRVPPDLLMALKEGRPLGLRDVYRYLALRDPIAKHIIEKDDLKQDVKNIIASRNKSILAHGFRAVGEDAYRAMHQLALDLVNAAGIKRPSFDILMLREDLIL